MHALALRCQIRIEPQRRRYVPREEDAARRALRRDRPQWGDSLRPFLWTHVATTVPGFAGSTEVDLPVTCTYDFEVAATKYLHALDDGDIPLVLLFSGTVFTDASRGSRSEPVAVARGGSFRLPVAVWRTTMDHYFPDSGWVADQPRHARRTPAVQGRAGPADLGPSDRAAAQGSRRRSRARERPLRRDRARSPTPSSTRATCSTPTARRRRRTRCAGSSVSSRRGSVSEADASERCIDADRVHRRPAAPGTPALHVRVRCLQVQSARARAPGRGLGIVRCRVDELDADGTRLVPWDEAIEHEIDLPTGRARSRSPSPRPGRPVDPGRERRASCCRTTTEVCWVG